MMKQNWLVLFALFCGIGLHAQVIEAAEYYLDTDPGPGNGIPIPVNANGEITEILPVNSWTAGMHLMGMRTRSSNGFWSFPSIRPFVVQENAEGILTPMEILAMEYFIDEDPGPGNAEALPLGAELSLSELISTGTLSIGMHLMGVRSLSSSGTWSYPVFRAFVVQQTVNGQPLALEVTAMEYFIDTDPGPGHGIELSAGGVVSVQDLITPGTFAPGMHLMGVRSQTSSGLWSTPNFRAFVIQSENTQPSGPVEIVAAEYYTDIDPGPGLATPIPIVPSTHLSIEETITQLGLELGLHSFSIRFKSSNGFWSPVVSRSFTICTEYGPLASFTYEQNGYDILFSSEIQNADSLRWFFEDYQYSSSPFPTRTYIPGLHPVNLTVYNDCGSYAAMDTVVVRGVSSLSPLVGSNLGSVSMYLHGAGFDASTTFRLNGPSVIDGENVVFNANRTLAIVQFNLLDHPIGAYTIEVGLEGMSLYTHPEPFMVSDTISGGVSCIWNPQPRLRVGRGRTFSLTITNTSNIDLKSIPFMMLFPANSIIEEQFEIVHVNLDGIDETASVNFITLDSTAGEFANLKVFSGMCLFLPSNRSVTYTVKVRILELGTFVTHGFIYNLNSESPLPIEQSIIQSQISSNRNGPCDGQPECWSAIANAVIDGLSALPGAVGPFVACASGIAQVVATLACASNGPVSQSQAGAQAVSIGTSLGVTVANCLLSVAILSTPAYAAQLALLYTLRQAVNVINLTGTAVQTSISIQSDLNDSNSPCFTPPAGPPGPPVVVTNSFDPNEIIGINEGSFYTNEQELAYSVFFENDSSATASAVEVHVFDTLSLDKFDFSTFQLGDIFFGQHHIEVPMGLKRFSTNYSLGDGYIVRVDVALDSLTGIVDWHFITLDSLTMDFPEDVFYGFLPPNVDSEEGQAEVRYTISRKASLMHGDSFSNHAAIVFDFNPPITTNNWINTLDLIAPSSQVLQAEPLDSARFILSCSGSDLGVGIGFYTLHVSINGGQFQELGTRINSQGQIVLDGEFGNTYAFYCTATDSCGNEEYKSPVSEIVYSPWPEQIYASASIENVLCPTDSTGAIELNLVGGDGNYSILWSTGDTNTQINNLSPGSYSVTIQDGIGNILQSTYVVQSPEPIQAVATLVNPACFGENGSAMLEITGGSPSYTVSWGGLDPGSLPFGEHAFSIIDQNHCVYESIVNILSPPMFVVESVVTADSIATCQGNISLNVSGGQPPYTYQWSHDPLLNTPTAEGLCVGNYSVQAIDANGCTVLLQNLMVTLNAESEIRFSDHYVLSPNPTAGCVFISTPYGGSIESMDVFDANGRLLQQSFPFQNTGQSGIYSVDFSVFPNGVYSVQIQGKSGQHVLRVILSKEY